MDGPEAVDCSSCSREDSQCSVSLGPYRASAMDRTSVVNYCLGLLSLLILQGVLSVNGRSTFNPGNRVFNPKADTEAQSKILALLLHKSLVPVEKDDPLGLELANKLAELEELRALREDLELERQITANFAESKAVTQKRGEPCFWKYCV